MNNVRRVDWKEFNDLVRRLADRIPDDIDCIYGIPRGGLIPAVMLSHILNIRLVDEYFIDSENLLVVDDIADSGDTIIEFIKPLHNIYTPPKFATIFVNSKCDQWPDYFAKETSSWIVFIPFLICLQLPTWR